MAVHDLTAVPLVVRNSQKKPRRRKTTLARALREAAKAGVNVAGATIEDGKVTLTFGEPRPDRDRQSVARRSQQGNEAMSRIRLKYVQAWVDREGRVHRYFRRRGYPRVPLPGLPGSAEFMAAYQAALAGPRTAIGAGRIKSGSVSAVVAEYFDSQQFFASKSAGTQRMRRTILERFRTAYGDRPIALLPTEWIEALLDSKPPHAARSWLMTLRSLCEFAVKRRWFAPIRRRTSSWPRSSPADSTRGPTTRSRNSRRIIRSAASRDLRWRCCSTPRNGAATSSNGPPARPHRRAHGEAGKDRRHAGDPGPCGLARGTRRHAGRAPDVPGHDDRRAVRRQPFQRKFPRMVRRRRIAEALLGAWAAQSGVPPTCGSRMQRQRDCQHQRTRERSTK